MLVSSILTFLTPLCAEAGIPWLLFIRIVIGFLHGVSFPAMQGAWSHWAPPRESSKLVAIHIAGQL